MHVGDDPIGIVRNGIYIFQRQHGAFKSGHTIAGNGYDKEFQYRFFPYFIPCPAQGKQAVEHATPAGRNEHDGKHYAQRLGPVG